MNAFRPWRLLAALLIAFVVTGCTDNSRVRKVTGLVTMDDAPLAGADLQFLPADPQDLQIGSFTGTTGADGKFEIALGSNTGKNAQPGKFVVLVTKGGGVGAPPVVGDGDDKTKELMKIGPGLVGGSTLPPIYADRNRSPFKVELKEGETDVGTLKLKKQ